MLKKILHQIRLSGFKNIGLVGGPLAFLSIFFGVSSDQLSTEALAIMASTAWVAVWWISEAIPIAATALLPIVLFPLTGGLEIATTTTAYSHPLIYLFLGGLILAIAIERWNLHRRIALTIVRAIGHSSSRIILGFMTATAFLSMWISNTATTLLMMPIGLAVIHHRMDNTNHEGKKFGKALMLGIAYSASIGGMATLIGTPPNLVFSGVVKQLYQTEINFVDWMLFALPITLLLLGICWKYLTTIAFRFSSGPEVAAEAEIDQQINKLGVMQPEEKRVAIIFFAMAFCWITRTWLINPLLPVLNDTIIAVAGALMLFIIPAESSGGRLLQWEDLQRLPWGILLVFGAGFAIAAGFRDSGLAQWFGLQLQALKGLPFIIMVLAVVAMINFLTEVTSNVSTATIMLPILAALAEAINVHPYNLMVAACLAASCAFMLPVATPPNAIVFGSGQLQIRDMVRAGLRMNIITIVILTVAVYYLLPLIWGLDNL